MLNGLRDILLGNEALVDEFAAEFKRELTRLQKERHGAGRRLMKDLQQVERGIKRCLDFITGGDCERRGEVQADLHGELVAILALSQGCGRKNRTLTKECGSQWLRGHATSFICTLIMPFFGLASGGLGRLQPP